MYRGYVKLWRRTVDSDIWQQSPLHGRVWDYLLMSADRNTGVVKRSYRGMAADVAWLDPRRGTLCTPNQGTIKFIIDWMIDHQMVISESLGTSNAQYQAVTICNWGTYQQTDNATSNTLSPYSARTKVPLQEVPPISRAETKTVSPLDKREVERNAETIEAKAAALKEQYPEVATILNERWLAHAKLPKTAASPTARFRILDTVRLMHTADELDWDTVGRIVEHAAKVWQPQGMIGSPASLRSLTRKGDRAVWEVILAQLHAPPPTNGRPGEPPGPPDSLTKHLDERIARGL